MFQWQITQMILKNIFYNICFTVILVSCIQMKRRSSEDTTTSTSPGSRPLNRLGVNNRPRQSIFNAISWPVRMSFMKIMQPNTATGEKKDKPIGIESLVMPSFRRQQDANWENDDQNMKMKLFRLMYESVRDSDLKVKRAEIIKKSYLNSSVFEIGYLMGEVTDKVDIMKDMEKTLKRLYNDWKPIEHINAYEQIANLAIDVGHIVEMLRGVEKKLPEYDDQASTTTSAAPPAG